MKKEFEIDLVNIIEVSDVCEFAREFNLENEIKTYYGVNDVFNSVRITGLSDSEVIDEMLDKYCKHYHISHFNKENCGYFIIYLFDIRRKNES